MQNSARKVLTEPPAAPRDDRGALLLASVHDAVAALDRRPRLAANAIAGGVVFPTAVAVRPWSAVVISSNGIPRQRRRIGHIGPMIMWPNDQAGGRVSLLH